MFQDEWVISRVFQKSGSGSGTGCSGSACGGGGSSKKARIPAHFLYSEASSTSSASLPLLLDSSPYPALTDGRDSCSYVDSPTPKEHVSCFSTMSSAAFDGSNFGGGGFFQLAPQTPSLHKHGIIDAHGAGGVSVNFPSLRSLHDNLQLSNHFLPTISGVGLGELGGCSSSGYMGDQDDHKLESGNAAGGRIGLGASELDCMWSY